MPSTDKMQKLTETASFYTGAERRRHVRVQDAVGLHVQRLVELPAAPDGRSEVKQNPYPITRLDKYSIEGYAQVRRDFPDVAQYISSLEERIRELLLDSDVVPTKPDHKVSLSAGGIHFSYKSLFEPGEIVSLSITLFPSGHRIGTDAQIVTANDSQEVLVRDTPNYRARFIRISDQDRGVIEQHVNNLLRQRAKLED